MSRTRSPRPEPSLPLTRPHTHDYTALAVSAARGEDGTIRLAASGVAGHAVRLPSAEAKASDPERQPTRPSRM